MPTPKEATQSMLRSLPDDASFDDIQYRLFVLEQIGAGERRGDAEGWVSDEEARRRLGRWLAE